MNWIRRFLLPGFILQSLCIPVGLGTLALALVSVSACRRNDSDAGPHGTDSSIESPAAEARDPKRTLERPAIDALDQATAAARKSRVSGVRYELEIDLTASEREFSGTALLVFDLSDASTDLTVDFSGGAVEHLEIHGVATEPVSNG